MQRKKTGGLTPLERRAYIYAPIFNDVYLSHGGRVNACGPPSQSECLPLSDQCDIPLPIPTTGQWLLRRG